VYEEPSILKVRKIPDVIAARGQLHAAILMLTSSRRGRQAQPRR
jgi:hypothetical protein